jgi:hypothetical protein
VLNYQIEVSVHAAAVKGALQMTANLFALLVAKNGGVFPLNESNQF